MPGDVSTLAIDVGATRTRVALVHGGRVAQRAESPTSKLTAPSGLGDGLVEEARNLLAKASAANGSLAAVGVSLAAAVDDRGDVVQERDFGIPAGGTLREALATAFELPVAVNNDANLAALAEHRLGAARGYGSAAVITLGSNIDIASFNNYCIPDPREPNGFVAVLWDDLENTSAPDSGVYTEWTEARTTSRYRFETLFKALSSEGNAINCVPPGREG